MKQKIIKGLIICGIVFLALFLFRLIYGFFIYPTTPVSGEVFPGDIQVQNANQPIYQDDFSLNFRNYASKKMVIKGGAGRTTYTVDQKYEKIANLKSISSDMDKDEIKIRESIKKFDALIQYEQKLGLKENKTRILNLGIGVPPEKFDDMVKELNTIGKIISIQIDKKDKSNEYKELQANKDSLMKVRQSLIALKSRSGRIDEFINLENRLLDIENQIQRLGLNLGEFDSENEFCTIKFSLKEKGAGIRISFLHRIKVAFEWTVKFYLMLIAILFFAVLFILIILTIIEKLGWLKTLMKK